MTTLREAAQQALEALAAMTTARCGGDDGMDISPINAAYDKAESAITALRAALAQQAEPVEPVAIADGTFNHDCPIGTLLFTAPPQRRPLTEGALMGVYIDFDRTADTAWSGVKYLLRLCRAVERAHGIGEQDAQV